MKMSVGNVDHFPDELGPLVDGDYLFICNQVETKTAKDGRSFLKVSGQFETGPVARDRQGNDIDYTGRPFSFTMFLPPYDEQYRESNERRFKAFLTSGNIPWDDDGFDTDDLIGARFGLALGQQKNSDYKEVKKFFVPA